MTARRRHSSFTYGLEMLVIRLRDLISPPAGILRDAGVRPGMVVLDFGCGPGGFALAAAELVGPRGCVHAVDVQPAALDRVRRAAARRGLANVKPAHGDRVADLPGESADFALLYDVLHIDPAPASTRAILSAIHRVLRPEGVLSATDHHLREARLMQVVGEGGLFRFVGRTGRTLQFERAGAGEASA